MNVSHWLQKFGFMFDGPKSVNIANTLANGPESGIRQLLQRGDSGMRLLRRR